MPINRNDLGLHSNPTRVDAVYGGVHRSESVWLNAETVTPSACAAWPGCDCVCRDGGPEPCEGVYGDPAVGHGGVGRAQRRAQHAHQEREALDPDDDDAVFVGVVGVVVVGVHDDDGDDDGDDDDDDGDDDDDDDGDDDEEDDDGVHHERAPEEAEKRSTSVDK
eukprot:3411017-Rhodomonas_salina.2